MRCASCSANAAASRGCGIHDTVFREWKSLYVRGRLQRAAAEHQLQLRQRVEKAMREEQAARLAARLLNEAMEGLRREVDAAQKKGAADGRRREREDALRIEGLQRQVAQMQGVAQRYLQARLYEVEVAHEERERAEAELARARRSARVAEQQADVRMRKAQAEWEVKLEAMAQEQQALQTKVGATSVAETLSHMHSAGIEQERQAAATRRARRGRA